MKLLFVFTLLTLNYSFSQTEVVNGNDIMAFNERIAQAIIDGDRNLDSNFYMSKLELRFILERVGEAVDADSSEIAFIVGEELGEFNETKNQFEHFYSDNFKQLNLSLSNCDSIKWGECVVDSSRYMFEVPDPTGRDKEVYWPDVKMFTLGDNVYVRCKGVVFISEGDKRYAMSVNTMYFDDKLKFYYRLQAPRISKIR